MADAGPSETLVEMLCDSIRQSVRHGRLAPGQRLVVADLAQEFGASAGPVREAIRRLTGEGLLEFTAHRGASVRSFTSRDVREIFQVREAIEGYAARLAAENIGRADYAAQLTNVGKLLRKTAEKGHPHFSNARQTFHDVLYEIAGNAVLREMALRLTFPLYRLYFNEKTGSARARDSLIEHEGIIEAILSGDGVRAERLMRSHLRNGAEAVCQTLEEGDAKTASQRGRKGRAA
ncbi:Transcriptional regulator, GntR family [uncultured Defluviicoccus sp.]|uniref:Transcriptional regulator, GntR family n=1 Tax=metagenome TaxID=256318 RepID=A0A380T8H0_9ZZZZ|nr:Transcriptional regulator, GntR family [uncultured Defluviicoccus sp.]